MKKHIPFLLVMALMAMACNLLLPLFKEPPPAPEPELPAKPEPDPPTQDLPIMADWFVTVCAYLDSNHNNLLDDQDEPLGGVSFTVAMAGIVAFGGTTPSGSGCYTITIPGSEGEALYPMTVTVKLPEDQQVSLLGSESVDLDYPLSHVDYLFTSSPDSP